MNNPLLSKPNKPEPGKVAMAFGFAIVFGVIGLVVWGAIHIIGSIGKSGSKSDAKTNSSQVATPQPQTSTPANTATQQTTGQQVAAWFSKYEYIMTKYSDDFGKIGTDAGNSDMTAVGVDCATLNADVTKAQSFPAIPDAQSASDFSSALTYYQTGAEDCVTAAKNYDNDAMVKAAGEMVKGNDKIKATVSDIKKVSS